jgi:hypothetical protein
MWPGARGPPRPSATGSSLPPHAFVAGSPGPWAGPWGAPSSPVSLAPSQPAANLYNTRWDQQALAAQFQTMQLQ